MKDNGLTNMIAEVRMLLELYYDGRTSPEDELRICELLNTINPLPKDLEAEKRFMSLWGDASLQAQGDIDVPAGLEAKIRLNLKSLAAEDYRKKSRGHHVWYKWSAAAVIAIIAGVGITLMNSIPESTLVSTQKFALTQKQDKQVIQTSASTDNSATGKERKKVSETRMAYNKQSPQINVIEEAPLKQPADDESVLPQDDEITLADVFKPSDGAALAIAMAEIRQSTQEVFNGAGEEVELGSMESLMPFTEIGAVLTDGLYPDDEINTEPIIEP